MLRLVNNLKYFLRYYGLTRALAFLVPVLIPSLRSSNRFINWKESALDRRLGIQTVGNVEVKDLDINNDARNHAIEYCPTSGVAFGVILEELQIRFSDYTFLDIGAGKGRVVCLASEFPFAKIIGIELSSTLCQAAEENLRHMSDHHQRCRDIRIVNVDATEFEWPLTPLVLYLFNPFSKILLARVLANVERSSAEVGRDIVLIYSNPVHRELLDASTFWQTAVLSGGPVRDGWAVYRSHNIELA